MRLSRARIREGLMELFGLVGRKFEIWNLAARNLESGS
jgi:hypothetical protein